MEQKKMPFQEIWRLNVRAFRVRWQYAPRVVVSRLLNALLTGLTPYVALWFSARLIDELSGPRRPEELQKWVWLVLGVTLLMALLAGIVSHWNKRFQWDVEYDHADAIYNQKMRELDYAALDDPQTNALLSQIKQNSNWGMYGLLKNLIHLDDGLIGLVRILGGAALTAELFMQSVPAAADAWRFLDHPLCKTFVFGILLLSAILSSFFSVRADQFVVNKAEKVKLGNRMFFYFGYAVTRKERAADARIYRHDKLHRGKADLLTRYFEETEKAILLPYGIFKALAEGASMLLMAAVYFYVCLKAYAGAFGVGSVTQYISAFVVLSGGFSKFLYALADMRTNAVFLKTTFKFLDIPSNMYQGSLTTEKRSDGQYEIEFRDVSFKYPKTDRWALRHVNMKFTVGKKLAIVGENGSGKTTFIKLLCRLYDPTEGEILLNGIDIRKYDYKQYLDVFAVVFQDFKLLPYALGQNVAASTQYDEERARECLEKAGFGDRLHSLPDGLKTPLYKTLEETGIELSGGEAQKIALARALYKDAPFIILDEPTAALDPLAEYEVYTHFNDIIGGKTAMYISHRLSSCRFCDVIAVFDNGQIVQLGTHEELLEQTAGKYSALWHAQAQYYTEDDANAESVQR